MNQKTVQQIMEKYDGVESNGEYIFQTPGVARKVMSELENAKFPDKEFVQMLDTIMVKSKSDEISNRK